MTDTDFLSILLSNLDKTGAPVRTPALAQGGQSSLCGTDFYTPSGDPVRDLRHMQARAADDLADWLVALDLQNKRPKTLYGYTREIAPLLRSHPHKRFDEFTGADINEELRRKPRGSRHITRSIYNVWFEWGIRQKRIIRNPMDEVEKIPSPRQRPKDIFTDAERAALEALPAPDGQLWTILFGTGLRRGEARRLRRGNVDLDRARLAVIDTKGGKDRLVPIPGSVIPAFADLDLFEPLGPQEHFWYRGRYKPGDPRRRRDPIGDTTFEHWYKRGIAAAGVRYLNPHQTRHTYGYWLRTEGFLLEHRALVMGHEDVRTTQRYDRISIDDIADRMAAL